MVKSIRSVTGPDMERVKSVGCMVLDEIVVEKNRVHYNFTITGNLQKYFRESNHMFLEYNHDLCDIPLSILAIPFVANVIPLLWITDSAILIDELDKSFYECLETIRDGYRNMFPGVSFKGNIAVEAIVNNTYSPEVEAAALFSGGLDALTTFLRIKDKKPLLITEYGWHEEVAEYSNVWEADKENAVNFAKVHGLENILIQSNYGNFIRGEMIDRDFHRKLGDSWWHGLHHGLAIISAAIPIAYKLNIRCIYIASSFYKGYKAPCASDPTIDNKIKYGSGTVFHDGYELTRQDKVKVVVDHYSNVKEQVNIRVCFKNEDNCCNCEKCLRTMLGIMAEGKNPSRFGFNVPDHVSQHVRTFLRDEVKFFTRTKIMAWNLVQRRMKENRDNIVHMDLLDWFLDYDFIHERRKSLFHYRVTRFFPILKRKIDERFSGIFARNLDN